MISSPDFRGFSFIHASPAHPTDESYLTFISIYDIIDSRKAVLLWKKY